MGVELGGGPVPAKISLSSSEPDASARVSTASLVDRLERVIREIERSPGWARWVSVDLPPGSWFSFGGPLSYGRVVADRRKGVDPASSEMVFFAGTIPDGDRGSDLLMGGWAGHLLDERAQHSPEARKGSRTEDFYDLWSRQTQAERDGQMQVLDRFTRLSREISAGDYLPLSTIARWAFGTLIDQFPRYSRAPLKGYGRVLARIDGDQYERPLILGTPLFVERSHDPEDQSDSVESEVSVRDSSDSVDSTAGSRWRKLRSRLKSGQDPA